MHRGTDSVKLVLSETALQATPSFNLSTMTTLQVETKTFPTSIPRTISHNQALPSSQFLSFRVQGRGLENTDLSFSNVTPDKSSVQEGPSSNTSASYNEARVNAATSTTAKHMASRKRDSTETKNGSRPGRQNGFQRPVSRGEIPPNRTTPRAPRQDTDWVGNGGGQDGVLVPVGHIPPSIIASAFEETSPASKPIGDTGRKYPTRASGFPRLPTKWIRDRGISAITTRRQALRRPVEEDSDVLVETVNLTLLPPAANDQRFIRREDTDYESRPNEGNSDAFYRDNFPRPWDYYSRREYRDDNYSPSPPRYSGISPSPEYRVPPSLSPPPRWRVPGPRPPSEPIIVVEKPTKKKSSSGKPLSINSTKGSPTRPTRPSDGIFQPVMTNLGRWQNRKASLWAGLNPTISKDNTMGEAAQQAKMLAEFGKKNRQCIFGVRIDMHASEEEHPYDSVDEPLDLLSTPISPDRRRGRDYSRTTLPWPETLPWPKTLPGQVSMLSLIESPFTDPSSSNDEDVTPTFEAAGLENEMKAWRLRSKDHNDDDNDDIYED